jgi:hypothetical protein
VKLYLAGPMTGRSRFNFDAFDHVARILRSQGFEVISPADLDRAEGVDPDRPESALGLDLSETMRKDLHYVLDCDGIVMLPGWKQSNGARLERTVAESTGRQVFLWLGQSMDPAEPWQENDIIYRAGRWKGWGTERAGL